MKYFSSFVSNSVHHTTHKTQILWHMLPALLLTISFITQYRTSDVAENLGRYLSCTEPTAQDFELILAINVKTRHPVQRPFGSEFPAICNHCGVLTDWSRKTWKFCKDFFAFFGKTTPYGKIFKIPFRKFTWRYRLTLFCSNVVKFIRREISEIVRYLPDQKQFRLPFKLSLLHGSHL